MKTLLAVVVAVMALALTGCAGTGIRNKEETVTPLKLHQNKKVSNTIFYKLVYKEAEATIYNTVSEDEELPPKKETLRLKDIAVREFENILKEKGYSFVQITEKEEKPDNGIFVEMRISVRENAPFRRSPAAGLRIYIFHPFLKKPVEIYNPGFNLELNSILLAWSPIRDEVLIEIARKTASELIEVIGISKE